MGGRSLLEEGSGLGGRGGRGRGVEEELRGDEGKGLGGGAV